MNKANINILNNQLYNAAITGDNKAIIELLNQGAEINSRHELDATPLFAAVAYNQTETVKLLIEKGANIEIPINSGITPLYKSVYECYSQITKVLIENGADLEVRVQKYTALFAAIYYACPQSVIHLLGAEAKLYYNIFNDNEVRTPFTLNSFLYNGEAKTIATEEIYPIVLNHYWNITANEIRDIDQKTISDNKTFEVVVVRYTEDLSWVAKEFPHDKVTIYNKGPNDIDGLPANCQVVQIPNIGYLGGTYLKHIADHYDDLADRTLFIQGHPYDVKVLLPLIRYKGDLDTNCKNIVAKCVNTTLAQEWDFLKNLAWDNIPRYQDFIPRDANMVEYTHKYIGNISLDETIYVSYGAIFAVDKEKILNHPVEHYAAILPEFNFTKPMVDHYQERLWDVMFQLRNITKLNKQLFNAAITGDNKAIIELLNQGAEINSRHELDATPLFAAVAYNQTETVKLLIEKGANIEIPINSGTTPLYKTVFYCQPEITKLLLEAGANTEILVDGYTPLCVAIFNECVLNVKYLLEAGANTEIVVDEYTPLYLAISYEQIQNVKYLLEAGASIYSDSLSHHEIRIPLILNSHKYNQEDATNEMKEIYPIVLNHYWNITADEIKEVDERTSNSNKTFEVVVVRYKEDLSWVAKEFPHDKVTIYNKGPDDLGELPANYRVVKIDNIGYLGGTYLKHIVDHYDQLADRTLFTQGDPYDANVFLPLIRHKETLNTKCHNIIAKCVNTTLAQEWNFLKNLAWDNIPRYKDFIPRDANMIEYTHKYIGNLLLDETFYVSYGAIFAVDKEKILNCTLEHYQAILPEFNYTKPMADHFQERLWDPLFEYCSSKIIYDN